MINIVRMSEEHLDQVSDIEKQCYKTPWSRHSFFYEAVENKCGRYIVALWQDECGLSEVIGYAGMWILLDEAHITNVAVVPNWRGKRIAEMMLRYLLTLAMSEGVSAATLEVRPSNVSALKLYKRLGFVEMGRRKNYYEDDGIYEDALILWLQMIGDNSDGVPKTETERGASK